MHNPLSCPFQARASGSQPPRGRLARCFAGALPLIAWLLLLPAPLHADLWYEHYARAEEALDDEDWTKAVDELNMALERKGDSGARIRTYGMKVTSYFPYYKLGIAYYGLGQLDAALQAFNTEESLGAITRSPDDLAALERLRGLVEVERQEAARAEEQRIREIVEQSIREAGRLEGEGRLTEALATVGRGLAVAPGDPAATETMERLRAELNRQQAREEAEKRAARLLDEGRLEFAAGRFSESASLLQQALALAPSDEIRTHLESAKAALQDRLEASSGPTPLDSRIDEGLQTVRRLEGEGNLSEALNRLQELVALAPDHGEALALQSGLLRRMQQADEDESRRQTIERLLRAAESEFGAGRSEQSLAMANQVLALAPGHPLAREYVARAFREINQLLLGASARQNIPPAIRFVDLRQELDDGSLAQLVRAPGFRLSGVVIDDSPVELTFYGGEDQLTGAETTTQELGDLYLTEFGLAQRLAVGQSTFRLVATDAERLSSSSQYTVAYVRPLHRTPWAYGALGALVALVGATVWVRGRERRLRLLRRRFNPYVAGAPVLDEGLFFGREPLVQRILETIHNNSLLLHGERRIGKTSLQHHLRKRLQSLEDPQYRFFPVFVDLQGTPEEHFFRTLAEELFDELEPYLDGLTPRSPLTGEYGYRDLVRDLHAILKVLRRSTDKKVRLVLLIDEVDELNAYDPRINQKLRSLFMKSFAESIVAVVSGVQIKRQWEREGSPWYNFFEEIEVECLQAEDAQRLIEEPVKGVITIEKGLTERIVALSGGRPYEIQRLCIALVNRMHESHGRTIGLADLEALGATAQADPREGAGP